MYYLLEMHKVNAIRWLCLFTCVCMSETIELVSIKFSIPDVHSKISGPNLIFVSRITPMSSRKLVVIQTF